MAQADIPLSPDDDAAGRRRGAIGLMILSSVGLSFGGLALRSMQEADAWQINVYRSVALVAVVWVMLSIRYRAGAARELRRIGRPGLLAGTMLAMAGICFVQAITTTTVANTLFTMSAIPFLTAALAWVFLREPLRRVTLVTMLVAAAGVGMMVAEGIGSGSAYGNLMALVTATCFSGFAVIVRRHRGIDMLPTLMVSGLVITAVSLVATGGALSIPLHDMLLCFLIGGVLSGMGNTLFITASRHLAAAELTLFMLLEFALGPIWVWIFVSEVPTGMTIIGGAVVIGAVTVRALTELRRTRPPVKRGRPTPY